PGFERVEEIRAGVIKDRSDGFARSGDWLSVRQKTCVRNIQAQRNRIRDTGRFDSWQVPDLFQKALLKITPARLVITLQPDIERHRCGVSWIEADIYSKRVLQASHHQHGTDQQ